MRRVCDFTMALTFYALRNRDDRGTWRDSQEPLQGLPFTYSLPSFGFGRKRQLDEAPNCFRA
jgi:hypothetical protein